MYRWKYPKKNLRNPKNINPNPKDSNQRERKRSEGEKDSDQRERKTQAAATQAREPQAWVARGLRLAQLKATRRASPRPGSRTVV